VDELRERVDVDRYLGLDPAWEQEQAELAAEREAYQRAEEMKAWQKAQDEEYAANPSPPSTSRFRYGDQYEPNDDEEPSSADSDEFEAHVRPKKKKAVVRPKKKKVARRALPVALVPYRAFMVHFKRPGKKAEVLRWWATQRRGKPQRNK
jgi:hypothetical protein